MDHGHGRSSIGLIAGAGELPLEAARRLRADGISITAVGFQGLSEESLAAEVEAYRSLRLGQMEALRDAMHALGMKRLLLVGKVPKRLLFDGAGVLDPDAEAIRLLSGAREQSDDALMGVLARWLETSGFEVLRQDEALSGLLAEPGPLDTRALSTQEADDLALGLPILRRLGRTGVGQCVVLKQGKVLALEAIEGTDAAIRRAGELAGAGATVVKGIRPDQDRRFDLPAVGPETIAAMRAAGASALAVEAKVTLVIDRKTTCRRAREADIAIFGFQPEGFES